MSETDFVMESGVDLDATTDVHLTDPATGDPWYDDQGDGTEKNPGNPVHIKVISSQSETFKRKLHSIQQRYKIKAKNNTGPNKGSLTYVQEQEYTAEVYAAIMAGWYITRTNGGPALEYPFNQKNAINWCKGNPLFAAQLSSGSDDLANYASDYDGNFTKKGSGGSTKTSKAIAS